MATFQSLLNISPTEAMRTYLNRSDFRAEWNGEAIAIWPCHKLRPDEIFWNHQIGSVCYAQLPLKKNGTFFFVPHGSQEAQQHGTRIPCSEVRYYATIQNGKTYQKQMEIDTIPLATLMMMGHRSLNNNEMKVLNRPTLMKKYENQHDLLSSQPLKKATMSLPQLSTT